MDAASIRLLSEKGNSGLCKVSLRLAHLCLTRCVWRSAGLYEGTHMATQVDFHDKGDFIFMKLDGRTTYLDLDVVARQGIELAKARHCYNFLIDLTQMESAVATYEIYNLPRLYESLGVPHTARLAVVAPTISKTKEDVRFYETVCRNSGFIIETIDEIESATQWLAEKRGATQLLAADQQVLGKARLEGSPSFGHSPQKKS